MRPVGKRPLSGLTQVVATLQASARCTTTSALPWARAAPHHVQDVLESRLPICHPPVFPIRIGVADIQTDTE
jgi:hypothetical protein